MKSRIVLSLLTAGLAFPVGAQAQCCGQTVPPQWAVPNVPTAPLGGIVTPPGMIQNSVPTPPSDLPTFTPPAFTTPDQAMPMYQPPAAIAVSPLGSPEGVEVQSGTMGIIVSPDGQPIGVAVPGQ